LRALNYIYSLSKQVESYYSELRSIQLFSQIQQMAQQLLLQEKQLLSHLSAVTAELSPLELETMSAAVVTASKSLASPSLCNKHPMRRAEDKG
jgi:hypothetical protein